MARGGRRLRGVLGWVPALVLVPAATFAVVHVSDLDDEFVALREVHPLDLGTTWVYQVSDHDQSSGTRTSQVVGRASLLGFGDGIVDATRLTRHYTSYPGSGAVRDLTSYLGAEDRTIVQFAQQEGTTFSTLEPPATAYQLRSEGDDYSYDGMFGFDDYSFDTELAGVEDLELGGRTFEDCAHWVNRIKSPVSGEDPVDEVLEEWTCPGYGPVKSIDRIDAYDTLVTEELIEFHGAEGNWWADGERPDQLEVGDAVAGSTDGFDVQRSRALPDSELGETLAWTDSAPGDTAFPPVSDGQLMVFAGLDGLVIARDADLGTVAWRAALKPPIVAPPALVGTVVLVADGTRRLWALSAQTGGALWVREFDDIVSASPTVAGTVAAVVTDDGRLTAVDLADGSTVWDRALGLRPRNGPVLVGDTLVVADPSGAVEAFDVSDGTPRWSRSLEAGISTGPAAPPGDEGPVVVSDSTGVLHAYAVDDGDELWAGNARSATRQLALSDEVVVVAAGTQLEARDSTDGRRLWRRDTPNADGSPTLVGDQVVLPTRDGRVILIEARTGRTERSWRLPVPETGGTVYSDVSAGLVGDELVFSGNVDTVGGTSLWAYPLDDEPRSPGVVLHQTLHPLGATANEPPAVSGDVTVVATSGTLERVDPDGSSTTLATSSSGLQTGAVVRDGVAYARVDDQLQAIDVAEGTVLWTVPSGAAQLTAQPAVSEDAVVFGVQDEGLASVDRETGRPRWVTPLPDAALVGTPVLLPDGDVLYAGAGLAAYDGTTGRELWRQDDIYSFGPLAVSDGVVAALSIGRATAPGISTYDVETGEQLWSVDLGGVPDYLGPAISDGVVVAPDRGGTVSGYSVEDGSILWRLPVGRPLAGSPVIDDGLLLLVGSGTGRNLGDDADYRVSAHDLRSGELVAGWTPGIMPFRILTTPSVGATDDGHVLVPVTDGLVELEAVAP